MVVGVREHLTLEGYLSTTITYHILRHVLDRGLPTDFRPRRWCEDANGSTDRRRRPDRRAPRQ